MRSSLLDVRMKNQAALRECDCDAPQRDAAAAARVVLIRWMISDDGAEGCRFI